MPFWQTRRYPLKLMLVGAAAALFVAGLGAIILAWLGLYNVAASTGHFAITAALLERGMKNSVAVHSRGIAAPDLTDPALLERGELHFMRGCAPCHGGPGVAPSAVAQHMLPAPPDLAKAAPQYAPAELFWIVKHGLKYTGMPAWPTQSRDDEVWAVVAFVRRLPSPAFVTASSNLADGGAQANVTVLPFTAEELVAACAACHGERGEGSPHGGVPRIAGQRPEYLARTLADYDKGVRPSGIMHPAVVGLSPERQAALARHFGSMTAPVSGVKDGASHDLRVRLIQLGGTIAAAGIPSRRIAACEACHGLRGTAEGKNATFPSLAGQHFAYLRQQLALWGAGKRGGSLAPLMAAAVGALTDEEIDAVAFYYASLPSGS